MMNRVEVEKLLGEFYAARTDGRLEPLCGLFAPNAAFKIAGASDGKPIAIAAEGLQSIRGWLGVMLKTFKLTRYEVLTRVIDGPRAAVYWRADIHSKVTGVVVPTELVDLFEVSDGRVVSYREFFAPC
jgi:ketosteroid isomerase-like protein